jgi:hypothetical protein
VIVLVIGAYLFQILEQHVSIEACQQAASAQEQAIEDLAIYIFNYVMLNATYWQDTTYSHVDTSNGSALLMQAVDDRLSFYRAYNTDMTTKLIEFRTSVVNAASDRASRYAGQDCEANNFWVTESSLLFTLSILTTIGYFYSYKLTILKNQKLI